jgi:RNA polymerase sigma factor for flagellar operon FliA
MPTAELCPIAETKKTTDKRAVGSVSREQRDATVLEHLSLVRAIAIRVHETLPVHIDLDDMIHAGVLGLLDAAERYDGRQDVAFKTFAKHRIKGAILDSLRQLDWASRDLRRRHKQVERITRDLTTDLSRSPSEGEIAEKMGVNVERWRQMAIELRMIGLISSSSMQHEGEDKPAPEFPATPELQPDRVFERRAMGSALEQAMQTLPVRYRKVVGLYYTREMTMKEIGTVLGINESRVSQIHKIALEKMGKALQSAGIHSSAALV